MSNERIDLEWLLEEDGLMQDLNWSIARFEQVEKLVKEMTAELKRCYKLLDDADYARSRYGEEEEHQDIDNVADAYEAVCLALDGRGRYC